MNSVLKKLKDEKIYACIHSDELSSSKFIYGKIIGVDENYYATTMVSPDGVYDGVVIKLISDIIYLEQSNSYDGKMAKLMDSRGYTAKIEMINSDDVLLWGLEYSRNNCGIVSVELNNSGIDDVVGTVEEINDGICKILTVDEYGEKDGVAYFIINEVSQLCFESSDEQRLSELIKK